MVSREDTRANTRATDAPAALHTCIAYLPTSELHKAIHNRRVQQSKSLSVTQPGVYPQAIRKGRELSCISGLGVVLQAGVLVQPAKIA
mmetsp:Transcript_3107/g.4456  ORF Transcript_3107/g.4456 Transcript_3107/m.4456 type:complete len:88 (-) Transcript_3107:1249-1512(-)